MSLFLPLVAGIASHGWVMAQKHRLEAKEDYAPAWWEAGPYRVCWVALTVLLFLIGIKAFTG